MIPGIFARGSFYMMTLGNIDCTYKSLSPVFSLISLLIMSGHVIWDVGSGVTTN